MSNQTPGGFSAKFDPIAAAPIHSATEAAIVSGLLKKAGFKLIGYNWNPISPARILVFSAGFFMFSNHSINPCYTTIFADASRISALISFFSRYGFHNMKDSVQEAIDSKISKGDRVFIKDEEAGILEGWVLELYNDSALLVLSTGKRRTLKLSDIKTNKSNFKK